MHRAVALAYLLITLLSGCTDSNDTTHGHSDSRGVLTGRPGGPYQLTLTLDPPVPRAGADTSLSFRLTKARSGLPVADLQVAHERLIHNFIVAHDFSSFAHIHHEDFVQLRLWCANSLAIR